MGPSGRLGLSGKQQSLNVNQLYGGGDNGKL
jgi:hypothetical protein